MTIPATQHAIQIVGVDEIIVNTEKPVHPVGPKQMMLQVEACGICFSDTKLLHAFDSHPRKSEVVKGLTAEELAEIPSYQPGTAACVPGHEPVARVIQVGELVTHFKVGDRILVQADWKHLLTERSNSAFGYNFEGALQEFVVVDERCVVSPEGEEFLIHVAEGPSAAAIGLIEPWATVEASYAYAERRALKAGGRLLIVTDAGVEASGMDALVAANAPAETVSIVAEQVASVEGQSFDDIVYFGSDADVVSTLGGLLGTRGLINIVLGGKELSGRAKVDVGRVHYDLIRYCGTTGSDPADGYAWIPADGEIRDGDKVAIVGAAGPMGLMHTMRNVVLGKSISIDATDLNDDRLAHLADVIDPVAGEKDIPVRYVNTGSTPLEEGYSYVVCLVPVPALVAQGVDLAVDNAIVNAFAGIPAGNLAELDVQRMISRRIFLIGTSGSDVKDMTTVVRKIENGDYDTTISLDAVTGMAGFRDAIDSVINRTSGGKIMVFPQLHDLGLVRLVDMPTKLPEVAAKLNNGLWTVEAEQALLATGGR